MNLPAHGTASPDPSKASLSVKTTHQEVENNSVSAWPGSHAARRNCSRPPSGIHSTPGASALPDPLFSHHRLADLTVPPGASQCRVPSCCVYRLAVSKQAARRHIRGILQLIFGTPFWLILQPRLLEGQLTFWTQYPILIYCQFPSYFNVVIAQPHPSLIPTRGLFILKSCHQALIHNLTDLIPISPFFTIILTRTPRILN